MKNYKNILKKFMTLAIILLCNLFLVSATNIVNAETEDASLYKTVRASHILVDKENDAWAIKSRLTEGEDFAKLAKQYSTDSVAAIFEATSEWDSLPKPSATAAITHSSDTFFM